MNEETNTRVDLSEEQKNAFISLMNVVLSMIPEKKFDTMEAVELKTGKSIPVKQFIVENYEIVTNGKYKIKFKDND
jgi:hypothetical protein